jgi:hypothetical protein
MYQRRRDSISIITIQKIAVGNVMTKLDCPHQFHEFWRED